MKVKAKIESLDFKEGEITLPKELENIFLEQLSAQDFAFIEAMQAFMHK